MMKKFKCKKCGKEFKDYSSHNRKYCSKKCWNYVRDNIILPKRNKEELAISNKGKLLGDKNPAKRLDIRKKMGKSQKKRFKDKRNHPMYGKHLSEQTKEKIKIGNTGKKMSEETKKKMRGRIPWNKNKKGVMPIPWNKDKKMTQEYRDNISKNHWMKKPSYSKEKNPNFTGGRKRDIVYSTLFNKELKKRIYKRDNYTCQICGKRGGVLHAHHIDFDKFNTALENLITLCNSCHGKTTKNPEKWKNYFKRPHKKYSLFIGRFQLKGKLHKGHIALIRHILDEGKNVSIMLRESSEDEKNPYDYYTRREAIENTFKKEILDGKLIVRPCPDIEEVCFGRKVGYDIREIKLSEELEAISATEIRKKSKEKELWD